MKEKNVKHLTKTLAVVSLLIPMSAQPLGIGDIQLHSALNQKLDAEIHLHLAAGENPSDVTVRLAPPEKFDKAGVPWNYFLSKIKFTPVVQANGSVIVKVTSREPLTEPFLDFLLEVVWPQGSQFREFTVLIDPPAAYHAPSIPSSASSNYQIEPLTDYERPTRARTSSKKRVSRAMPASNITPQTPTSGEYGPTRTADTLWGIADRLGSQRNVPTQQMMAALYRANPDAFIQGNIDALRTGVVLNIPETEAILQTSGKPRQAAKPTGAPAATASKALELVAPTEAKVNENADISGQVKPGQSGTENGISAGDAAGTSSDEKDQQLQSRIERLEQQLNMMQQLLALKDQQLSALQNNDKQAAQEAAQNAKDLPAQQTAETPPELPPVQPPVATPPEAPAEQPAAVTPAPATVTPAPVTEKPKPTPPPPAPVAAEEGNFFSSSAYYLTVGGLSAGIIGLLGWLLWRKRRIESQTNTESMFASASQIRMPDSDSALSVPVMDINSTGAYDVGTVGESSFISDFTPSDFEAFDTDQSDIDPLSEADVYLAYGRYQQAEDLIQHAIKDQPTKDDYKLKLFEIFYANENKERFAEYAQQLADEGKNADHVFWNKVTEMAKEIIPASALFGGTGDSLGQDSTESADTIASSEGDNSNTNQEPANFDTQNELETYATNDDLDDLNAPMLPDLALMDEVNSELAELQLTTPEESDDNSLDFDLNTLSSPAITRQTESPSPMPDIESIDFDLSDLSEDKSTPTESAEKSIDDELESFDFDFNFDSAGTTQEDDAKVSGKDSEPLDMASLESFQFPEFEETDIEETPAQETVTPSDSKNSADEFDFNFDFDAPTSSSLDDEIDFGVSDLTDMDEFETKIDLAKAYIDMGDADAAKVIAEEVLEKGNPEQKQAAQALLDELN